MNPALPPPRASATYADSMRQPTRAAANVAWTALGACLVVAYTFVITNQLSYGLEYDESYLLNVARNIANGAGYIDDGVSFWTSGQPFDPNISTGPTLILPGALMWLASDGSLTAMRLIPVTYFFALLAGLWVLLYRWMGRWTALAGLAGPLLLSILSPDITNESLMPGRFVGEIAALALLVWSAVLVSTNHPIAAGLLAGLTILTKANFALGVVVLATVWLLTLWLSGGRGYVRFVTRFTPAVLGPLLVFEAYKLLNLGAVGYLDGWALTRTFISRQSTPLADIPANALMKAASLGHLVSIPAAAVIGVALLLLMTLVLMRPHERPKPYPNPTAAPADWRILLAMSGAVLAILAWWVFASAQPSLRPAVPAFVYLLAVLSAMLAAASWSLFNASQGRSRMILAAVPALTLAFLAVVALYQGVRIQRSTSGQQLLADQQEVARVLTSSVSALPIDGFWTNPEFTVLTDLPQAAGARFAPELLVLTSLRAELETGYADATALIGLCGDIWFQSANVVVCVPARLP